MREEEISSCELQELGIELEVVHPNMSAIRRYCDGKAEIQASLQVIRHRHRTSGVVAQHQNSQLVQCQPIDMDAIFETLCENAGLKRLFCVRLAVARRSLRWLGAVGILETV